MKNSPEKNIGGEKVKVEVEINLYDYKILENLANKEEAIRKNKMSVADLIRKMVYKELSFLSSTLQQQREVFDYWNNKKIIKHKDFQRCRRHISSALKTYNVKEIKEAVDNYATVLKDGQSYWSHKWDLISFLLRGIDRFMSCNKPLNAFNKVSNYKTKSEPTPKYKELT